MTEESGTSTAVLADSSNLPVLAERTIQDSSDEEVTLRKAAPKAKETVAAGVEEERVEPMIHLPLPIAFKSKSEVYRARQRFTHLNVENLKTAKTESIVHDRKRPSSSSQEELFKEQKILYPTQNQRNYLKDLKFLLVCHLLDFVKTIH